MCPVEEIMEIDGRIAEIYQIKSKLYKLHIPLINLSMKKQVWYKQKRNRDGVIVGFTVGIMIAIIELMKDLLKSTVSYLNLNEQLTILISDIFIVLFLIYLLCQLFKDV